MQDFLSLRAERSNPSFLVRRGGSQQKCVRCPEIETRSVPEYVVHCAGIALGKDRTDFAASAAVFGDIIRARKPVGSRGLE
jgi:hypothetical protein